MQTITKSEKQTINFAKKFSRKLKGGDIIGLIGKLGAGKTIFAKGLAQGLGIKKNITSPTFVLMKIYPIKNYKPVPSKAEGLQITNFIHIDAYRVKSPKDIISIGAEEYFNHPDTIAIIEWADRIKKFLPKTTKFIKLTQKSNNTRIIKY